MRNEYHSCYGCSYFDGRNSCMWFEQRKLIPKHILSKGCKFYDQNDKDINTTKIVAYMIDKFDGEII